MYNTLILLVFNNIIIYNIVYNINTFTYSLLLVLSPVICHFEYYIFYIQ